MLITSYVGFISFQPHSNSVSESGGFYFKLAHVTKATPWLLYKQVDVAETVMSSVTSAQLDIYHVPASGSMC